MENEFLGSVRANEFEIWERQQHAIHARGRVTGRRGGTRIEMRFVLSTRSRVLLATFVVLYVALALGLLLRPAEPSQTPARAIAAIAGAGAIALIFVLGAQRQRTDLRKFIDLLFRDVARP